MDAAHFARLNHQQQQQHHLLLNNSRNNGKSHYSNRQQQTTTTNNNNTTTTRQQPNKKLVAVSSGGSSSASDELVTNLGSSRSSAGAAANRVNASGGQQAMLAHHQMNHASHTMQSQQKQHLAMQKHRQLAHHQQQQHHRQAALQQAHHAAAALAGAGGGPAAGAGKTASGYGSSKAGPVALDNITTSSSSDNTLDDLHQLAHGYGGAHHRLADRYGDADSSQGSSQSGSRFLLGVLFTLAEMLLFLTLLLWLYWVYQHDDGLAWQLDRKQQFNTHAALMLLGFIFLNGQAMLIYRSFQCCNKIYTKILHTILFVLATSAISLGLILGFSAQENVGPSNKPIMHFYSLHAWTGLATTGLFVLQFVFGFISFLILLCCDTATSKFRAALLPIHKTFGLIIFSTAIATCLTGLLQTARSRLSSKLNKVDYHELSEAGIIVNLIGVCLICLAILMPYIIRNLDIKRPPRSDLNRHLKLSQLDMRIG